LRLGCAPASFVHIIHDNVDENIGRVLNTGTSEREGTQLIGKAIPAKELSEVDAADLQSLQVLEGIKRDGRIKRELLIATN
jgi:hypothetical protein